jgi:hypothetical protein
MDHLYAHRDADHLYTHRGADHLYTHRGADLFFELIGPRALVVCVLISKFELSYFTPNINAVFLQNDPPYGSLMDHKKLLFHFENRSKMGPNSQILQDVQNTRASEKYLPFN